jgi:hypothetical protein
VTTFTICWTMLVSVVVGAAVVVPPPVDGVSVGEVGALLAELAADEAAELGAPEVGVDEALADDVATGGFGVGVGVADLLGTVGALLMGAGRGTEDGDELSLVGVLVVGSGCGKPPPSSGGITTATGFGSVGQW